MANPTINNPAVQGPQEVQETTQEAEVKKPSSIAEGIAQADSVHRGEKDFRMVVTDNDLQTVETPDGRSVKTFLTDKQDPELVLNDTKASTQIAMHRLLESGGQTRQQADAPAHKVGDTEAVALNEATLNTSEDSSEAAPKDEAADALRQGLLRSRRFV